MTRALFRREFDTVARTPAFAVAVSAHAGLLGIFVLAWGDGVGFPPWSDRTFYGQLQLVQAAWLIVLLPWTAARCMAQEDGDDLVHLSALTATRPRRLIAARACALVAGLWTVVLSGAPIVLVASRLSDTGAARLVRDEAAMLALAVTVGGVALAWRRICRNRLLEWLAAVASTALLAWSFRLAAPTPVALACALALFGAALTTLVAVRADASMRYLSGQAS